MKRILFLAFLCWSSVIYAQDAPMKMMIIMSAKFPLPVFDTADREANELFTIPEDAAFCAATFYQADPVSYWKIVYHGKIGFVADNDHLRFDHDEATELYAKGIIGDSARTRYAMRVDKAAMDDIAKQRAIRLKNGFAITSWSWTYENEYSSVATVDFTIGNYSKKRIKYVTVYVSAKNAVNDRLTSLGNRSVPLKGIGPIEPGESGTYSFDHAFWSKVIDTMQVDKINVQYFDGSQKTLTTPRDYVEE